MGDRPSGKSVFSGPGTGYPPSGTGYPPASGAGYPPATGSAYPAAPGANYPPATGSAYPAAPGANYPPATGSAYPAAPGANYPPTTGSPYPAAPGANYPPATGSAYPAAPGANYPPATGSPYPAAPGAGYPPATGSVYPAAPVAGYPPATGSAYPATPSSIYPSSFPQTGSNIHSGPCTQMSKPLRKGVATQDPSADAAKLHKAFKGIGCNEKKCFEILCRRTSAQAVKIYSSYKSIYNKCLIERIKSETSGATEKFMVSLVMPQSSCDAYWILYSVKGLGTDDLCLVEMLTSRSWEELQAISAAFKKDYGKDMASEIKDDTSGTYMKFLLARIHTKPRQCSGVDLPLVSSQADVILNRFKGVSCAADYVIDLLTTSSDVQIRALDQHIEKTTGKKLIGALKEHFSGWFLTALTSYVSFCLNKHQEFAERLKNAMVADDQLTVSRILTTRGDIDLGSILEQYDRMYKVKFAKELQHKPDNTFWNAVKVFVS